MIISKNSTSTDWLKFKQKYMMSFQHVQRSFPEVKESSMSRDRNTNVDQC